MKKSPLSHEHEKIVAQAMAPVARELRLIDIADLIAMLRYEQHGNLSDLVTTAADLYFLPDTIRLGSGGDYVVDWDYNPKIVLDIELCPESILVYVRLTLEKDHCGIEINHIEFDRTFDSHDESAKFLREAIERARFSVREMGDVPNIQQQQI